MAGRGNSSVVHGSHLAVDPGRLKISARELVPGALPAPRDVLHAVAVAVRRADERLGEVPGVGGAADLVVHHPQLVALAPRRSIVATKFSPADAEQPRGADDVVARVRLGRGALARAASTARRPTRGRSGPTRRTGSRFVPSKT